MRAKSKFFYISGTQMKKKNAGSKTKGDMFTGTKNIFKPFKFIQYDTILNYTCSLVEI